MLPAPVPNAPVEDDQVTVLDISGRTAVHVTAPDPKAPVEDDQETVLGISGRSFRPCCRTCSQGTCRR